MPCCDYIAVVAIGAFVAGMGATLLLLWAAGRIADHLGG